MRARFSAIARRVFTASQIDWVKRHAARPLARHLDGLARLYGTDKGSHLHGYTRVYASYLASRRRTTRRVLEVGVGGSESPTLGGNSLRMWRSYFPRAQVIGIDLYPKQIFEPRITIEVCDQGDADALRGIGERHGPFDLVVDDGSHIGRYSITTFRALFPFVVQGGLFVIEDCHTSYMPEFEGGPCGTPGTPIDMVKGLLDELHLAEDVARVDAYRGLVVVTRGPTDGARGPMRRRL